MAKDYTQAGSRNLQEDIFTDCPELFGPGDVEQDEVIFPDGSTQVVTRSTLTDYDTTSPPPIDFDIGWKFPAGETENNLTAYAQNFVNTLMLGNDKVQSANEAFKIYLKGTSGDSLTVAIHNDNGNGQAPGDILYNTAGAPAQWNVTLDGTHADGGVYFEITVEDCYIFDADGQYWFVITNTAGNGGDIIWIGANPDVSPNCASIELVSTTVNTGIYGDWELGGNNSSGQNGYCIDELTNLPATLRIDSEKIPNVPPAADVNLDGKTGVMDIMMAKASLDLEYYLTDVQQEVADTSGDNELTIGDIQGVNWQADYSTIEQTVYQTSYLYSRPVITNDFSVVDINNNSQIVNWGSLWDCTNYYSEEFIVNVTSGDFETTIDYTTGQITIIYGGDGEVSWSAHDSS